MSLFFIVLGVMLLITLAMSVGVLLGRKPISGSCGGMSALGMDVACDICGGDKAKCDKESQASEAASDFPSLPGKDESAEAGAYYDAAHRSNRPE